MKIQRLQTKIFLFVILLFIFLFVINLFSIFSAASKQATSLIETRLQVGQKILMDELVSEQINFSQNVATLAKDWAFRQAVGQGASQADLKQTLTNQVQRINADFAFITDMQNQVLATTRDDLLEHELDALLKASELNSPQFFYVDGLPYVAASEVIKAPVAVGYVYLAYAVDEAFIGRIAELVDLGISLIRQNGKAYQTIFSSTHYINDKDVMRANSDIGIALDFSDSQRIFQFEKLNNQQLALAFSLTPGSAPGEGESGPKTRSIFVLHESISNALSEFEQFWYDLVPYILGVILFSLIGALGIARGITQPVNHLLDAVRTISRGNYSKEFNLVQDGELGELASEFQIMQEAIRVREIEIKEQAIELQESDRIKYEAELAKKEKELALEATQAKSDFLARMSHEIRTPLTSIIGFSDALKLGGLNPDDENAAINTINRSGSHLLSVINDILDVSKIEAQKIDLEIMDISLFSMLMEIEKLTEIQIKNKGIEFKNDFHFPLPKFINSDPTRCKQILINLINNAVKFTEQGSVSLRVAYAEDDANFLELSIVDTGIGMTPEQLGKLFSAFSQADASTTRKFGGTGLGLYICKELAELLGGAVTVASEQGRGSQFTLRLPVGPIDDEAQLTCLEDVEQAIEESSQTAEIPLLQGHVLFADDNADNRRLVSHLIARTGAQVSLAENGEQAVEIAMANELDLVLMDMQMPVMDGLQATELLIATGFSKPVIMMTANVDKDSVEKCLSCGAQGHFGKPIDTEKFYVLLSDHLVLSQEGVKPDSSLAQLDDFEALVNSFKQDLPDSLYQIEECVRKEDFRALADRVHQVKGSAGSFGFTKLTQDAAEFEKLLKLKITRLETNEPQQDINKEAMYDDLYQVLVSEMKSVIEGNT